MGNIRIPKPRIDFNPPVYYCKKATKPFTLDGNIEKDFWADADFTEEFVDIEGKDMTKPRYRTQAKMLWDDENLYFGAILEGDEIWGTLTERDCVIFYDNDFEIFVDPDSDTHQYFEFEMNAKNTVWDLFLTKPYRDFGGRPINGWDIHGLQTAVHIDGDLNNPNADNKRWMVEVVMPFAALKEAANGTRNPQLGEFYRINFSRVQWLVDVIDNQYVKRINPETNRHYPEDNWVWAPTGVINIHYPELWGFVFFTENGETYPIPETEQLKWELRKVYYKEQAYRDLNGCYTDDLEALLEGEDLSIDVTVQITNHSFELSCFTKDKKSQVVLFGDGKVEVY